MYFQMSCCISTKHHDEIKWQKVEAILAHLSGDFLVRLIAYHGHFWHVFLKYQHHFRAALIKAVPFPFAVIQLQKHN